jgi:antitoxin MazE
MSTTLSKWGNSLAIRIPTNIAERANIQEGDALDMQVSRHGRITLTPLGQELNFGKLYEAITPENRYSENESGQEQ